MVIIMTRALIIVLDSVGIGAAPDADKYGDKGSDTLGHIAQAYKTNNLDFSLPHLATWGLDQLKPNVYEGNIHQYKASSAILIPESKGKDTTTGHWEMAGVVLDEPFATFPDGFPKELLDRLSREAGCNFIGNKAASGTVIIEELGPEHLQKKAPIIYTSADSVLQIAAHESIFPIDELYRICEIARKISDDYRIGRVIARPFTGEPGNFKRTVRRHDYSMDPPRNILNILQENNIPVTGIGKIKDIFNGSGVGDSIKIEGNTHGIEVTHKIWKDFKEGLVFVNLVDFDMLYGHRNKWKEYGAALMEFDRFLPSLEAICKKNDLIIITADHGNDPTFPGTDHNRENVPALIYQPGKSVKAHGNLKSFAVIAAALADHFGIEYNGPGKSFL